MKTSVNKNATLIKINVNEFQFTNFFLVSSNSLKVERISVFLLINSLYIQSTITNDVVVYMSERERERERERES